MFPYFRFSCVLNWDFITNTSFLPLSQLQARWSMTSHIVIIIVTIYELIIFLCFYYTLLLWKQSGSLADLIRLIKNSVRNSSPLWVTLYISFIVFVCCILVIPWPSSFDWTDTLSFLRLSSIKFHFVQNHNHNKVKVKYSIKRYPLNFILITRLTKTHTRFATSIRFTSFLNKVSRYMTW